MLKIMFTKRSYSGKINLLQNYYRLITNLVFGGIMLHLTKYYRRIKLTLIKAMSLTCLFCLFYIPVMQNKGFGNDVGYYTVVLDGKELGAVNSLEEANEAFTNARLRLSSESADIVYMDPDFNVYKQSRLIGTRMSESQIEDNIYQNLASSIVEIENQTAYTVRIDDFTVTVASKDDVLKLIEGTKKNYDANNEFQVTLETVDANASEYAVNIVKSVIDINDNNIVASTINGTASAAVTEGNTEQDGLKGITFSKEVTVSRTTASESNVLSVDEALASITKEKEEKTFYKIVIGDCLSTIAAKNNLSMSALCSLNPGLTENTVLMPDTQLIITVPTPELSVVTTKRLTYEEDYNAEVQYVDNNSMYRGTNNVIQQGTTGHRKVIANVTYTNGTETSRAYVQQTIVSESQPRIIEVGTLTPPTYVRPISGGQFSSGFGWRAEGYHSGVDWSCSQGTTVIAAASGTVIKAGYFGGYGYCVEIRHSNGVVTRYAHLSKILVSAGQTVTQYNTIALTGNTGDSTGPHLHFEVIVNGNQVNPLNYVNKY